MNKRGDYRKSPSVVQGQSSNRGLGQSSPADKLKVLAHVHIIFSIFALCKISLQVNGEHGSNGPMVNTLMSPRPIHFSLLPLHPCILPSRKEGVRRSFAGKILKFETLVCLN